MTDLTCNDCGYVAADKKKLERHKNRKYPCNSGKYSCDICKKKFSHRSGLHEHKKHHCPGPPEPTMEQKDMKIRDLQIALDAVRGMGEVVTDTSSTRPTINVIINPIFNHTKINILQNNGTDNAVGQENIDYI